MAQLPREVIETAQRARVEVRKLARQTRSANRALADYDAAIERMIRKEHGSNERSPNNRNRRDS